jgi:replicative DNA helicase
MNTPTTYTDKERVAPQNVEAEMSLLGSVLIDKEAIVKIADLLGPKDFYKPAHGMIFESMLELFSKNEPIDVLTLSNRIDEKNQTEKIGGKTYLAKLSNIVPTASHAVHYAQIIQKKAILRRLLEAAHDISQLGYADDTDDLDTVLDKAQQHIFGIGEKHMSKSFTDVRSILDNAFERIDELHREKGKLRGVPTGITKLDELLAGLQKSDLVILAARPSVGKTSLALDFVRTAAVKHKIPVGLFSLEMGKEQLVDRLLCAEAKIDLWKLRTGNLSDKPGSDDFQRIGHAMGTLAEAPIFIDDNAGCTVMQIRTKARRLKAEHGLGLIVIDYLQLMEGTSGKEENRVQEVSKISRQLKNIARELDVPVLALSQLSRAVEQTKPAIPKLAHLRESGSIEQDADVVMFLYRKAADRNYQLEEIPPDERHIGEIHIAKHRNGPTGMVKVFFDAASASYRNLETSFGAAPAPAPQPNNAFKPPNH